MTMHLTITTKEGVDKRIEVTGLHVLELKHAEEERFRATLQAYVQEFYDRGFKNVEKVEIQGRFGSGQSGACVFPIVLFTPGTDPKFNHYRVLKYDDTSRVKQELFRYNSLASQAGGTYEQLEAFSSEQFPEKSLLSFRNLGEDAVRVDEFLTRVLDLLSQADNADLRNTLRKALQDVLGRLYERHYCNSVRDLAKVPGFTNLEVHEIFAALFPAVRVIDEDPQEASGSLEQEGMLIGLDAVLDPEYRFRKKYLLTRKKAEDKICLIEVMTRNEVDEARITAFLTSSVEDRIVDQIQGVVTQERPLDAYICESVASSALPDNTIYWRKLYAGLQRSIALPYWAFYLHHDLNPSNILIIEKADGTIQGKIIDYYSFGRGGHLFTDVTRLEALILMEYVLRAWQDLFEQQDYVTLQSRAKAIERAMFLLNSEQPDLSRAERDFVDIVLEIRRIGLNWLIKREAQPPEAEMAYRNYLFARYAYLLAFQKYSSSQGSSVPKKKQVTLLFADALLELIELELKNLNIAQLLADLNEEIFITDADVQKAETFRRTQKTALLVIMFIDVVNSTQLREELGEVRFQNLLREKKSALSSIIKRGNTGEVVKDTGDGLLGIFAVTDAAVQIALEIQETLASHPTFKVRIGIDMGQVTQETEHGIVKDVFGSHVNRAARIEALGAGGHVLTSYTVWDNAKRWLKHLEHIVWKKHGSYRLKGISDPQEVYEPYNPQLTEPLEELSGEKVSMQEELRHCKLCGRYVKLTETFTCRTCGTEGICTEYCFNKEQRQCLECISKASAQHVDMPLDAQKLIDLHNSEASFTIRVWTERGEKRESKRNMVTVPKKEFGQYKIGGSVVLYFQSDTDAYVYMINIGPTGDITHIFPNEYVSDNKVKGGKKQTFPDKDASFEWILQEPAGVETVKAVATKVPVDIEQFLQKQLPKVKIRNIVTKARLTKILSPDQWAEASCTLLVQK